MYFCTKCKRRHRYDSKIGIEHLQHNEDTQINPTPAQPIIKETNQAVIEDESPVVTENRLSKVIHDYRRSYKRGVMKFGIWWKILQLSIWGIVLIFLVTATIIFVFFLPKIELINLKLK